MIGTTIAVTILKEVGISAGTAVATGGVGFIKKYYMDKKMEKASRLIAEHIRETKQLPFDIAMALAEAGYVISVNGNNVHANITTNPENIEADVIESDEEPVPQIEDQSVTDAEIVDQPEDRSFLSRINPFNRSES